MGAMASQITSLASVYSAVQLGADQRKYQRPVSLAFVWGINSPHKWPVRRRMFPFDDVIIMYYKNIVNTMAQTLFKNKSICIYI